MKTIPLIILITLISGCSINSKITLIDYSHIDKSELQNQLKKLYSENNIVKSKGELDHLYKNILVSSQEYPDFKTANQFTLIKYTLNKLPPKNNKGDLSNINLITKIFTCDEKTGFFRSFTDGDKKYILAVIATINNVSGDTIDLRNEKNICFKAFSVNYTYTFNTNTVRIK
jgi:hypothetical protein